MKAAKRSERSRRRTSSRTPAARAAAAPVEPAEEASDRDEREPAPLPGPAARPSARGRRSLVAAALCAVGLAVVAPIALWAQYHLTHVVSRDALVKGHIAEVGAQIDGVVKSLSVDAGDRVRAGQVVVRLEDRHLQARVRSARSQLERATRELGVERLAIRHDRRRLQNSVAEASARVSAAGAGVWAARSQAEDARERHQLRKSLAEKGIVAQEQLRSAGVDHRTALARVAEAEADREAATAAEDLAQADSEGLAVREKRISVLEAEVEALRAELAVAEAELEATLIRAPDDGAVVRRIVELGGSVVVGQPIISLWLGEELWIEAWIDEEDLSHVGIGDVATVSLMPYPDREFSGVVEMISASTDYELPEADVPEPRHLRMRNTPLVAVRIRLDERGDRLFPGLSAKVAIRKDSGGNSAAKATP